MPPATLIRVYDQPCPQLLPNSGEVIDWEAHCGASGVVGQSVIQVGRLGTCGSSREINPFALPDERLSKPDSIIG
jgi:hypothetical protein